MNKSIRPKVRPTNIGATESGSTRGISPKDNYSKEDLKKLTSSAVGKMTVSEMKRLLQNEKNAKNRAMLREGIEKAVAKAMSNTGDFVRHICQDLPKHLPNDILTPHS